MASTSAVDVLVAGAGPAGASAAFFLAGAGREVLLVDKASFPREKTCGDGLTPRALAVLESMGLLEKLEAAGCRCDEVQVYSPDGASTAAQVSVGLGTTGYSVIIPRYTLDDLIRRRAVESGARFEGGVLIEDLERRDGGIIAIGTRGTETVRYRAQLAILATGASTPLLMRTGILSSQPRIMLAARTYFEQVPPAAQAVQFRFDGVPLPGYGWVFPLRDGAANVGAGFLPGRRAGAQTSKAALERWLAMPALQALLVGARQREPIRGYPLRVDFLSAPTFSERVLLAGEAAGLVNPLTGEGIDYALESGRMAAEHAAVLLERGTLTPEALSAYDRDLRKRFGSVFAFCERVRDWFLPHPPLLNVLVRLANRRPDLKVALVDVALGGRPEIPALTPWLLMRALLSPSRRH